MVEEEHWIGVGVGLCWSTFDTVPSSVLLTEYPFSR